MKTKIFVLSAVLIMTGCATFQPAFNDQTITSAVAVATSTGLQYGIHDTAKRAVVANYVDVVAAIVLRATTGAPSPADLTAAINAAIPAAVKADFPEIVAFVTPLVVSNYQIAYQKWGSNVQKLYQVLNDIAAGLEAGAAPYISQSPMSSP